MYVSNKFKVSMIFRFRVNLKHGTDRRTDRRGETDNRPDISVLWLLYTAATICALAAGGSRHRPTAAKTAA